MVLVGGGGSVSVVATTFLAGIDKSRAIALFSILRTSFVTTTLTQYRTVTSWYQIVRRVVTAVTTIYTLTSPINTRIIDVVRTRFELTRYTQFLGVGERPPTEKVGREIPVRVAGGKKPVPLME